MTSPTCTRLFPHRPPASTKRYKNHFNLQQDIPEHHELLSLSYKHNPTVTYSYIIRAVSIKQYPPPPPPTICVWDGWLRSKIVSEEEDKSLMRIFTPKWARISGSNWNHSDQNHKISGVGVITSNRNAWFLLINQSSLHLCDPPPGRNKKVFGIHPLGLGNGAAPPPRRAAALWWRLHTRLSSNTVAAPVTASSSDLMAICWFTCLFVFLKLP